MTAARRLPPPGRVGRFALLAAALFGMGCVFVDIARDILEPSGVWYVATDGDDSRDCLSPGAACRTIQAAVDKASEGGEIQILSGTHFTAGVHVTKSLRIFGAGVGVTIVEGAPARATFNIGELSAEESPVPTTPPVVFISRLTLMRSGRAAVWNTTATVYLVDVLIRSTEDPHAVAVLNHRAGHMFLHRVDILDTRVPADAGCSGVENLGEASLRQVSIVGVTAGRAVCNWEGAELLILDSRIEGNNAVGVLNRASGSVRISASTIRDNHPADAESGGLDNKGTMTVVGSTIADNSGDVAGGVLNDGTLTLERVTISGNLGNLAGGLYNEVGASARLVNVTISGNTAPAGAGGILTLGTLALDLTTLTRNDAYGLAVDASSSAPLARRSIFADNTPRNCAIAIMPRPDLPEESAVTGVVASLGWNLDSDDSCTLNERTDLPDRNARLLALADNGGGVQTHALTADSPAFDGAGDCRDTDARGISRPQGERCDIGAYEAEEIRTATSGEPPHGLTTGPSTCRAGPATNYPPLEYFVDATELVLHARDSEGMWIEVSLPEADTRCWVALRLLEVDPRLDVFELPAGVIPPTPTPSPVPPPDQPPSGPLGCWHQGPNDNGPVCYYPCPAKPSPGGTCSP